MYRNPPNEKIYVLGYRDLIYGGSYLINSVPYMARVAESLDEAVKKFEVINTHPSCLTFCMQTHQQCRGVQLPETKPSWFTGMECEWRKLLNPKVIWEIRQMEKTQSDVFCQLELYEIKKIKKAT